MCRPFPIVTRIVSARSFPMKARARCFATTVSLLLVTGMAADSTRRAIASNAGTAAAMLAVAAAAVVAEELMRRRMRRGPTRGGRLAVAEGEYDALLELAPVHTSSEEASPLKGLGEEGEGGDEEASLAGGGLQ